MNASSTEAAAVPNRAAVPDRFRSLDAWRGISALFVAAFHFHTLGFIHTSQLVQNASRFVDFFFVLSGFVIATVYRERLADRGFATFILRRIGRLWPLHVVMLAVLVAIAVAGSFVGLELSAFDPVAIPAQLTLTHAWRSTHALSWNGPSWSISTEMFAYLAFGLLAWLLHARRLDWACALIVAASAAVLIAFPLAGGALYNPDLVRCLFGFMTGALAARLWQQSSFRPRGEIAAAVLMLASVAFLPETLKLLLVPLFAWVVLVFASDAGTLSKLLHRPFPQLLGRISYSIYMVHFTVALVLMTILLAATDIPAEVDTIMTATGPWWLTDGLTIIYLGAVVAVSCLTYAWIERPGQRWLNQRSEKVPAAW